MADNGQDEQEDGIWLEDYYFITDDDGAVTNYVWAADANNKLEKREVTLGDFNDETFKYEVLDGLTVDDYIAFPGDDCVEGAPVTQNSDDVYSVDEELDGAKTNSIFLDGYICKLPVYRKTPLGREIADLLLAVNRPYGKSDYIPCICWGRNARYASAFEVGEHVQIIGRIQSRTYIKKLSDTLTEERTAYEVSVSKLECVEI